MIRRTIFAVADSATRYTMSGILVELEGDKIKLVATDGHRLALTEGSAIPFGDHTTKGQAPVVPTKAMSLLERNLQGDTEETVKICVRPNDVLFRTETAVIYSRLVEGRFPDYKRILPGKHSSRVSLPVGLFMAVIKQAKIMADEESKRVTFRFEKNKLTLEAQGTTTGRSKVDMPIELEGKPVQINFNPDYIVDMLKVLQADGDVVLEMEDPGRPALFRSGANYTYLAMPLT